MNAGQKGSNASNVAIGKQIQLQRERRALSQTSLAQVLGVTIKKIERYESGAENVGAETLLLIASVLNIPIHYFFAYRREDNGDRNGPDDFIDVVKDGHELVGIFSRIKDENRRRMAIDLVRALAEEEPADSGRATSENELLSKGCIGWRQQKPVSQS